MHQLSTTLRCVFRRNERGAGRLKFIIVVALIAAVGYAGSQYVPVAYQAFLFKDFMQEKVNYAAATGQSAGWVENQLRAGANGYEVPPDAVVSALKQDGRIVAHVQFMRPVLLPGLTYPYNFDHSAKSNTFLSGN